MCAPTCFQPVVQSAILLLQNLEASESGTGSHWANASLHSIFTFTFLFVTVVNIQILAVYHSIWPLLNYLTILFLVVYCRLFNTQHVCCIMSFLWFLSVSQRGKSVHWRERVSSTIWIQSSVIKNDHCVAVKCATCCTWLCLHSNIYLVTWDYAVKVLKASFGDLQHWAFNLTCTSCSICRF